jgi:hypothetical protein
MSQEPLLPSYGAATQRTRSSEYRLVAKHTHTARAVTDTICAPVFFTSAILTTVWAAGIVSGNSDLVPSYRACPPNTAHSLTQRQLAPRLSYHTLLPCPLSYRLVSELAI